MKLCAIWLIGFLITTRYCNPVLDYCVEECERKNGQKPSQVEILLSVLAGWPIVMLAQVIMWGRF